VNAEEVFIVGPQNEYKTAIKSFASENLNVVNNLLIQKTTEASIPHLSHHFHEEHHRCGGFFAFETEEEAAIFAKDFSLNSHIGSNLPFNEELNNKELVNKALSEVEEVNIRKTIEHLSSYHNRYYTSDTGVKSSEWIKSEWENLLYFRKDAKVEFFEHKSWPQASVIATIQGSTKADEIVIIGGHQDSIAGFFGGRKSRAPGADDNASGIASITEILRVFAANNIKPERTIQFMAYAAEEVGLRGSKEIARKYKNEGKNVVGVMQLDMTNFKGSDDFTIILISDHTNKDQNTYLGKLIDEYLKVPWGYSKCGYGCSDHASWNALGYPASFPHEAQFKDSNKKIHTSRDLINLSGGNANHAVNFARLGLSYAIELSL
ncbi:M20/M25/M40 family metallo-hydrolase, partial [Bacteriovoracaceae bacterium]|nr:M20/M25/M40 family metallo-hydrolase [Bacteriovoracaceae bacterium]